MQRNTLIALQCCRALVFEKDPVAPFAPQAFYPYFWSFLTDGKIDEDRWDAWFTRSLEIVKICDAVYFYTAEGLPDIDSMSEGMRKIQELATSLGLECKYFSLPEVDVAFKPILPALGAEWI